MRNKVAKRLRKEAVKFGISYKGLKRMWARLPTNAKSLTVLPQMMEVVRKVAEKRAKK